MLLQSEEPAPLHADADADRAKLERHVMALARNGLAGGR